MMLTDEKRFQIAKEVAEQLWREQQLTSNRMTWNLTFQGFLFTAVAVAFNLKCALDWEGFLIEVTIGIGGMFVAIATRHSILASQYQRKFLKDRWHALYLPDDLASYPRPFADNKASKAGRRSAMMILWTVLLMWSCLIALVLSALISSHWSVWVAWLESKI